MRPPLEGVVRPVEVDAEGVIRELVLNDMEVEGVFLPDTEGVARPPRDDATDDGRGTAPGPTVGAESFVVAMKTPQLGGHEKYCLLERTDEPKVQRRVKKGDEPIHGAIILAFAGEPAGKLDAGPEAWFAVDGAKIAEGAFVAQGLDSDIVADFERAAGATGAPGEDV